VATVGDIGDEERGNQRLGHYGHMGSACDKVLWPDTKWSSMSTGRRRGIGGSVAFVTGEDAIVVGSDRNILLQLEDGEEVREY
jgi:hypothetical protein